MNARDRVLAAFAHTEPDRVPIDIGTMDTFIAREVYEGLADLLGTEPSAAKHAPHPGTFVTPDEQTLQALGADVRLVDVPAKASETPNPRDVPKEELLPDGTTQWTYPDGRVCCRVAGEWDVQLYQPAIRGDLTLAEIDRVLPRAPRPTDWADAAAARAAIARQRAAGYAVQCNRIIMPFTFTGFGILDFTRWCLELASAPDLLCDLMDRSMEHCMAGAESFYTAVGAHMDMVYGLGDDVASHTAMWMSPADYRRYIKPRHAEIIRFIKQRTQAKIIFHCCGACRPIIPDLIEIGVDALNPVQITAGGMAPERLKREFGRDIAFWGGGVSTQGVLDAAGPAAIRDEVRRNVETFAPGGGFVFTQVHNIQADVPPENIVAAFDAARELGGRS